MDYRVVLGVPRFVGSSPVVNLCFAGSVDAGPTSRSEEARTRFEALAVEQLDSLYRSALRLTRNRSAAEDLVQDVMLNAWRSFHTFHEGTSIRAWLHRILMNGHFTHHRKQTREPDVTSHEEVGEFYLYDKARRAPRWERQETQRLRSSIGLWIARSAKRWSRSRSSFDQR